MNCPASLVIGNGAATNHFTSCRGEGAVIADVKLFLGQGLYSVTEAALYARVKRPMMRRWVFGDGQGEPVITPQIQNDEKLISFLDFVQTLAIRTIRRNKLVPLQRIREAMDFARERFGMQYPFAMRHTTYLWGDSIVIVPPGADPNEEVKYVEATGRHKGSILLKPIVEVYLEDLSFNPATGLAEQYEIFERHGIPITMNPHRRFGEPLLPSGYSARTIWDAVEIEGGVCEAATAYGISREEVEAAMRFLDALSGEVA